MIVLNKKTIRMFVFGIFVFALGFAFISEQKETVPTVSLPVSGKTIVVDAGHGSPDDGASSSNGTTENEINLSIALKVQSLLEQTGATVILTRSDENGIYDLDKTTLKEKKVSDIKNRVKIGNGSQADIFVSIHLNKIPQGQYWGWQTFFKKDNKRSEKLAILLQESLNESIQKENKREPLKIEGKYIVDHVEIPISVVECGFLSNVEEEALLKTEDYQEKIAWGIYAGIIDYFAENN